MELRPMLLEIWMRMLNAMQIQEAVIVGVVDADLINSPYTLPVNFDKMVVLKLIGSDK